MQLLKRLWLPLTCLSLVLLAGWLAENLFSDLLASLASETWTALFQAWQVLLWLAGGFVVDQLVRALIWDGLVLRLRGQRVPRLMQQMFGLVIFFLVIVGIVGMVFDRPVTAIWTATGGLGIVVGLAVRDMILDVFSGIAINVEQPFKIGHWICILHRDFKEIEITDGIGCVTEINWRTTRIRTIENNTIVIPNSKLSSTSIVNFTLPGADSRFELDVSLDASVPVERGLRILGAAVQSLVGEVLIPERKSKVKVNEIDEVGVSYRIKYWIRPAESSPSSARHRVTSSILAHLRQAGITLAYPKQDLFYQEMPPRQLDTLSLAGRIELLSQNRLFGSLEEEARESLATTMKRRFYKAGGDLIRQGDEGDSMFILFEGLVAVVIDRDGEEVKVAQMEPGSFFGEMSLLTGDPRSATIRGLTDTVAFEITRDDLDSVLKQLPEVAETLSRAVAKHQLADSAREEMSAQEREAQTENAARQIVNKMKSFFKGVF